MLSNPATLRRVGEEGHETGIADKPRQVISVAEEVPLILTWFPSLDEMWFQNSPGRKGFTTVSSPINLDSPRDQSKPMIRLNSPW